ncbi:serine hydrolase domain-containing protein [Glycomyces harbinensis]|uniref:D-alanyl-D-alanine carboxypeptidase n=1 Tax=Glycomyces harbinensis TaxID=58114 RepID=A0A1G6XHI0_9ACTN|nr:serine hydrolase domain-containing protein [Glycomyces harbinensis]SDD76666.1 D-alanyl-D-alanine carboxypeptidase [Glycomyces harbinensis]
MHRRRIASAVVTATAVAAAAFTYAWHTSAEEAPFRDRLQADADSIVDVGVTGVQARVTDEDGDTRAVVSGVADIETGESVDDEGLMRIGSVTKTFVAAVLLQLAGEGVLSLEDTVEDWLPGVVQAEGIDGGLITIRQLLQHTSGLPDYADAPDWGTEAHFQRTRYDIADTEETLAAALAAGPVGEPGQTWSYSNPGYIVLGMIIEEATGHHWAKAVHDRIVRPLELDDTYWAGFTSKMPEPHANLYHRFEPGGDLVDVTEYIDHDASGGLISTTADIDRFMRALIGGDLIEPAELHEMQRTVPVVGEGYDLIWPGGASYGLGIFRLGFDDCGDGLWVAGGDVTGAMTRAATTEDGEHSATVFSSTELRDSIESGVAQNLSTSDLIEHALCEAN